MFSFDFSRLVPAGLSVYGVEDGGADVIIRAHRELARGTCPDCGTWSADRWSTRSAHRPRPSVLLRRVILSPMDVRVALGWGLCAEGAQNRTA